MLVWGYIEVRSNGGERGYMWNEEELKRSLYKQPLNSQLYVGATSWKTNTYRSYLKV